MLNQIAAYTGACLATPACVKGAKTLWKRFSRDDTGLAHAVVGARAVPASVSGTTVRVAAAVPKPVTHLSAGVTIRQATAEGIWHPALQTDLIALSDIGTGWTVMAQAPPGFSIQLVIPGGTYRVAGVRLAGAESLPAARVLGLAAATALPFERLPQDWAAPGLLPRYLHNRPLALTGPVGIDLVFVGEGTYGSPPRTHRALLAMTSPPHAA